MIQLVVWQRHQSNGKAKLSLISILISLGFNKSWLSVLERIPLLDVWVERR
ncbi:hypothetical protein PMIT1342_00338 [Prochlorococcus marinus str. MIT 1342]|nr:hypothetical protein PMIT1342_00338 [Prochlorococcus marinus str. MIT 1342]